MTVSRRRILVAATATVVGAVVGRIGRGNCASTAVPPSMDFLVRDRDTLILHDGGPAALAFARGVRVSALPGRVSECVPAMLSIEGFTEAGARLDQMRGGVLLSLRDDADTVVVEALLRAKGVESLILRRYGRQVLLSAYLPT